MRDVAETTGDIAFVESWRKRIGRAGVASSASGTQGSVEICIAPVRSLVRHPACAEVLSFDEARQFAEVRSSSARDSMTAGRMLLRIALSRAARGGVAPRDWRLRTAPNGKPEVSADLPQVHFSVAHTERIAVVATSGQLPVGIDAESIEQTVESDVASSFCCPGERATLRLLPPPQSTREFLRLWTLKEAYAKLTGAGVAMDFSSLGFSFESLALAHAPSSGPDLQIHFETMFVASGNGLSHVSVAIGLPDAVACAELQVVTLTQEREASAVHIPCVSTPGADVVTETA